MKIAVVFDTPRAAWQPEDHDARMEHETSPTYGKEAEPEYQVAAALRGRGHEVVLFGFHDDPGPVTAYLREHPVDVVFNAAERFHRRDELDFVLPALLEATRQPYTGAPPQGLVITRNKAVSKTILEHHGFKVPRFDTYRIGEKVNGKLAVKFPAIVKPLASDASTGIAKASVVYDRDAAAERVAYVHERIGDDAIVEEYIEGRELYVSALGNGRKLQILPAVELVFEGEDLRPEDRIATKAVKWSDPYRERNGIKTVVAESLSPAAQANIEAVCKVAFDALWLRDYARFDLRLDADDQVWLLEANANPYIGDGHELASAAQQVGLDYPSLIERIVKLAAQRCK